MGCLWRPSFYVGEQMRRCGVEGWEWEARSGDQGWITADGIVFGGWVSRCEAGAYIVHTCGCGWRKGEGAPHELPALPRVYPSAVQFTTWVCQ